MFRTVRRLRLEQFEGRSLPSAPTPIPHPPADTAVAAESADEDPSEYTTSGKSAAARAAPGTNPATPTVQPGRPMVPDYVVAAYPSGPPMPTGLAPAPAPAVGSAPAIVAPASPATMVRAPAPAPLSPIRPPAPPPPSPEQTAPPPTDDRPDDGPADSPSGPPAGSGDQPAVPDGDFPPVALVVPSFDDLNLQLNLAGWVDATTRLLDGLDALVDPLGAESPWARLGYWTLVIGTVGVTVELTRQGLRARQPDPAERPPLPVRR